MEVEDTMADFDTGGNESSGLAITVLNRMHIKNF
jgi:hypothetical protein